MVDKKISDLPLRNSPPLTAEIEINDSLVSKRTPLSELSSLTETLTNKTINTASNTITIVEADISDLQTYTTDAGVSTLTNKTIDTANNTLSIAPADVAGTAATLGANTFSSPQDFGNNALDNASTLELSSYITMGRIAAPADPAADKGRIYVKQIDSNNDGIFIKIKKAGSYVEVQIA